MPRLAGVGAADGTARASLRSLPHAPSPHRFAPTRGEAEPMRMRGTRRASIGSLPSPTTGASGPGEENPAAYSMKAATSPSAIKVQSALGDRFQVLEFDESTRTAADAAAAIGCTVAQIAKSLVFRSKTTNRPVLVIASGASRVDEQRVATLLGEPIVRADARFVRDTTGFSIGGVPPVAHRTKPLVLIDEALAEFAEIWAAAGTPNAVFKLAPADLVAL